MVAPDEQAGPRFALRSWDSSITRSATRSTRKLERLTTDKALVEHELRETQQPLSELRRGHIAVARATEVIADLRLLYEAAKPEERRELMRVVIRRIVYRGTSEPRGCEFFDGGAVNLPREGSKLSNGWLRL